MMLRGTQLNYMPDKSHVIIIIINTNHTNLFHMGRMFNMKSCCGRTLPFGPRKGAFQRGQFVIWPPVVIIMIVNVTFLKAGYLVCVTIKWLL